MLLSLDGHPRWKPTGNKENQSKILPGTENGERIRVNAAIEIPEKFNSVEEVLICQAEGTNHTIYSLWKEACEKYGHKNCLGDRRHGGTEFKWRTYSDCKEIVDKLATAIVTELGQAQANDCKIGMFAGNCWEWTLSGNAIMQNKQIMVPLYDTLGDQAMRFITKTCEFEVMFIEEVTELFSWIWFEYGMDMVSIHYGYKFGYDMVMSMELVWI